VPWSPLLFFGETTLSAQNFKFTDIEETAPEGCRKMKRGTPNPVAQITSVVIARADLLSAITYESGDVGESDDGVT
jgi:hypothetical protein